MFTHHSETAETFQLRNCQFEPKLKMYVEPEGNDYSKFAKAEKLKPYNLCS